MAATASSQDAAPRASAAGDHLHIAIPHAPAAETVVPALGGAVAVAAFEKEDSTHSDSTAATLPSDVDDQAGAAAKSGKAASASPGAAAGDAAGEGDNPVQHEAWRRWVVLFVSAMGVFMATVSTSALVIAFPTIIKELRVPIATMMWILLVPLLMICAVVPIAGKLGDVFGQVRGRRSCAWPLNALLDILIEQHLCPSRCVAGCHQLRRRRVGIADPYHHLLHYLHRPAFHSRRPPCTSSVTSPSSSPAWALASAPPTTRVSGC